MIILLSEAAKMAAKAALLGTGLLFICGAASAQQSMTVEELEDFILKKKAELSESVEQRDEALDKRAELEQKLADQAGREQELEDELRSLCDEREEVEPGSLDECLAEQDLETK